MDANPSNTRKIGFFNAPKIARELDAENSRLRATIDLQRKELDSKSALIVTYGIEDAEEKVRRIAALNLDVESARKQLEATRIALASANEDLRKAAADVVDLRDAYQLQGDGLFDFSHPAESSASLAEKLASTRSRIKEAVRTKQATSASTGFTFNGSEAKGRKFVEDMSKMMLRAYNAEAENCVIAVRAGNVRVALDRLSKARDQIRKLGTLISLDIRDNYHRMRTEEIELAARHLDAVKAEKERDREEKERLREERKAQQELERAREKLQKELNHYRSVLAALEARGDSEGAARIMDSILSTENEISQVDFRSANIRAGYVYVISNLGALGSDVVKIGMTRRLEPMDRINELGDASVPFRFDVHALFFSKDAVGIETMLHQHFSRSRLNQVNLRREFFRVKPLDVLHVLQEHQVEIVEFTVDAPAEEFRLSQGMSEEAQTRPLPLPDAI